MDLSAAMVAAGFLSGWVWPIVEFLLGLGLVIVAHEFGHFIVAKAVGIRVERFAVGFGPRLLDFRRGETEYCLNLLPFGGYVKMLGQDDFRPIEEIPREEMDPRSYRFKSVGARFLVISAGVVMNAILAMVLFVIIAMVGKKYVAPVLGEVRRHWPASQARIVWHSTPGRQAKATSQPLVSRGLRVADRITRIEGDSLLLSIVGNEVQRFDRLSMMSVMADADQTFKVTVERDVDGHTWVGTAELGVEMGPSETGGERLSFGILPAADTLVKKKLEYKTTAAFDPYRENDRVVAVGGRRIDHEWEIAPAVGALSGTTVPVTVQRGGKEVTVTALRVLESSPTIFFTKDGTKLDAEDYNVKKLKDDSTVWKSLVDGRETTYGKGELIDPAAEEILDLLGMVPRLRITGIIPDSAAEKAGLHPGDIIVEYGDSPSPTIKRLRGISKNVGRNGTYIVVERDGERLDGIRLVPRVEKGGAFIGVCRDLDLGSTIVGSVREGSPAAKAKIEPGSVITQVNDRPVRNWLEVYEALVALQGRGVSLTCRPPAPGAAPTTVSLGRLEREAFDPDDYEFSIFPANVGCFDALQSTLRKEHLGEAIAWGARETVGFMVTTYASIRALIKGTVSRKDFVGPVGIGALAVQAARADIMHLVYVMAFMSAILAVMNFLPLPVLDGGHALFLLIEKLRGKPVSVKVMNYTQFVGLGMILLLLVALTWQDIMRFFG
jgi:regulator of sigma E protease